MLKRIKYITIGIVVFLFGRFAYNIIQIADEENNATPDNLNEPTTAIVVDLTGTVLSPFTETVSSGTTTDDYQNFQTMVINKNYLSFTFPDQPSDMSSEEKENKDTLDEYLKENNRYFNLTKKITKGYLSITTKLPARDLFLYRHNTDKRGGGYPINGTLLLKETLTTTSDHEYLYKLDNIPLQLFKQTNYSFNRQTIINTSKTNFIGGYINAFDGNKIEEIIIARE